MSIERVDQAKAALKVFFCAVNEWELLEEQGYALLGAPNQDVYDQYKRGTVEFVSDDILHRLANITTIYGNLRFLFSSANIVLWLKNKAEKNSKWQNRSPLDLMLGGIEGIETVYDYLNALRG